MKKLFLSSSFSSVSGLLEDFVGDEIRGKTITFIPTASIPESVKFYVKSGMKSLEALGLKTELLELTKTSYQEIEGTLIKNDYIYVSGGNSFFLLQELRKRKVDVLLLDLIHQGKLYIGESAGAIILANNIEYIHSMDDRSKATELDSNDGLKAVDFSPLPHFMSFPFKKVVNSIIENYSSHINLLPFRNSQAVLVEDKTVLVKDCVAK